MPAAPSNAPKPARLGAGLVDPRSLMAIRSLEFRARVVVEGFWRGLHRSPYHGFSAEFTEYRQYSAGDDTRYLDWRLYARSDRFYLKRFEDETNLRCHLVVDRSRSMAYASAGVSKWDYARTLAATLAWFLHGQGDAVGLVCFDDQLREYLPPRHRRGQTRQLMLALEAPVEGRATDVGAPLRRLAELARRRGLIIVLSDLLAPLADWERSLARLTVAGHEVIVIQILDPNEVAFRFDRPALFQDLESGRELYVEPGVWRPRYQAGLEAHLREAAAVCQRLGAAFQRVVTDQPLELVLAAFLRDHRRRGRLIRRRETAPPAP